jgi:hypothetical protein
MTWCDGDGDGDGGGEGEGPGEGDGDDGVGDMGGSSRGRRAFARALLSLQSSVHRYGEAKQERCSPF